MGVLDATLYVTYDYKPGHGRRLPEPGTLPLLVIGLVGIGVLRRRAKRGNPHAVGR